MKYLVSKGANVNAKDNYGITPLLAAVYENHSGAVQYLLSVKADKSIKGPDGKNAKDAAETEAIKKLL
jgi:ankyrin repeat protein